MKNYALLLSPETLAEFQRIRNLLLRKANSDELRSIIAELRDAIPDSSSIEHLRATWPYHFVECRLEWDVELGVATQILNRELDSSRLTYIRDLTHYVFYFRTLPDHLRATFFLQHGIPVKVDTAEWKEVKQMRGSKPFAMFKQGQEMMENYLFCDVEIAENCPKAIRQVVNSYSLELPTEKTMKGECCLIQAFFD